MVRITNRLKGKPGKQDDSQKKRQKIIKLNWFGFCVHMCLELLFKFANVWFSSIVIIYLLVVVANLLYDGIDCHNIIQLITYETSLL